MGLIHGTTLVSSARIERKGAKLACHRLPVSG